MEHDYAVKSLAAERYILGELSPEEQEEFQQHYLGCAQCTEDIGDLQLLSIGTRTALRNSARGLPVGRNQRKTRSSVIEHWFRWTKNPACAWIAASVALTLAVYPQYQLRTLHTQAVDSLILKSHERGKVVHDRSTGRFVMLELDLPGAAGDLEWELRKGASDAPVEQGFGNAPQPGGLFKLLIPSSRLDAQKYRILVRQRTAAKKNWEYSFKFEKN